MDRITRRRFLEQSLWVTAAGIAGIGLAVEGQTDSTRRTRRVGANDKIHIACIGVNGRGMAHVGAYLGRDDVELVAICDADESVIAKAQEAAVKKGRPKPAAVQDIRKLLEDKNIDAVSIATPNHWHALAAIWAMQAGKDVYVEKPVSHNVSEGRRIVEVARKTGHICQAGTQSRSSKACRDAMEFIHSGKIGKVTLARGLCYKPRGSIGKTVGPQSIPASVNYDLWCGPAPNDPPRRNSREHGPIHYDWHWFWNYGNGDLGNQGIHQMDIARWALNKKGLPQNVMSLGGRFGYDDDGETPNTEVSFFDYGDCHLIFEVRGLKTEGLKGEKIGDIVYGTEGYVVFSDNYGKATAFDNQDNPIQKFSGGGDHFANFLDTVRSRKVSDLHADIEEGHLSSALCHLGNISYRLGEKQPFNPKTNAFGDNRVAAETFGRFEQHLADNGVKLEEESYRLGPTLKFDSKKEQFHDNPQANAMLTRNYRTPFVVPQKA